MKKIKQIFKEKYSYMDKDEYRLASLMHNNYQYFARKNKWGVQKKTDVSFEQLPEANRRTMIDLAKHLIKIFNINFNDICVEDNAPKKL